MKYEVTFEFKGVQLNKVKSYKLFTLTSGTLISIEAMSLLEKKMTKNYF